MIHLSDLAETSMVLRRPDAATETRSKVLLRLGVALAIAVGLVMAPVQAPSAHAYDKSSCQTIGEANLKVSTQFYRETPNVVFDDFWVPPFPRGTAVICLAKNHHAGQVLGNLTGRNINGKVSARVSYYDEFDNRLTGRTYSLDISGSAKTGKVSDYYSLSTRNVHRARVALLVQHKLSNGTYGAESEVAVKNLYWS